MTVLVDLLGYGTIIVNLVLLGALLVFLVDRLTSWSWKKSRLGFLDGYLKDNYLELAFLQALVATVGSLYLSNFLGWEPCRLCWFQRIAVYPMTVLIGTAILLEKKQVEDYIIPLAIIGIPIAAYHYIIQRFDQFHSAGCSVLSVSCSTKYTFYAGYVSVPMMALTAMVVVLLLMWRFSDN